jgi:hypothetical protein
MRTKTTRAGSQRKRPTHAEGIVADVIYLVEAMLLDEVIAPAVDRVKLRSVALDGSNAEAARRAKQAKQGGMNRTPSHELTSLPGGVPATLRHGARSIARMPTATRREKLDRGLRYIP